MTISSSTRKAGPFTGNGVTVAFPFTFKVFSTADLYVVQADSSGTETVKTLTTDYTVSLNADQNATPGGTVTMLSAPATGYTLTLTSNVAQTQSVDLQNNGGFYPSVINTALDKLTVLIQQMQTYLTGALKLPVSASGVSATLPAPVANKILGWNSTASAIANLEPSSLASLVAYGSTAIDTFTGTGSQTAFTLTQNPSSQNNLGVFLNGLGLTPGVDFTWNSSAPLVLTMTTAPTLADELVVRYQVAMAQGSGTSDAITYTPAGTGAVATTVQTKLRESVSVFDFMTAAQVLAVQTNSGLDVTAPVQAAINYVESIREGVLNFPRGDYAVTTITLSSNGMGTTYNFNGASIGGIASSATDCVVAIKCWASNINDLNIGSSFNLNYTSGVHWYTNNAALQVNYNKISGVRISGFLIGMTIGANPGQSPNPAASPAASGLSVDTPMSEDYIAYLETTFCLKGLYYAQANGKLTLVSPMLGGVWNAAFTSAGKTTADQCAIHLNHPGSELTVLGGEVVQNVVAGGKFMWVQDGHLEIVGSCLESQNSICIGGGSSSDGYRKYVGLSNIQDWGLLAGGAFFNVLDTTQGYLNLSDLALQRAAGYAGGRAAVEVVSDFTTLAASANGKFSVNCSNVYFSNFNFTNGSPSSYQPLINGCRSQLTNIQYLKTDASTPPVVQESQRFVETHNLLNNVVDLSFGEVTAYGVNASATSQGWTFTNTGTTSSWGKDAAVPTIEKYPVLNSLHLLSVTNALVATSAAFPVMPSKSYMVKGWMKTTSTATRFLMELQWFKFSGAASATPQTRLFDNGTNVLIGTTWTPFMMWAQAPSDAATAKLSFNLTAAGVEIYVADLKVF